MKAKPGEYELAQMLIALQSMSNEVGRDDKFAKLCFDSLVAMETTVERQLIPGASTKVDRTTWLKCHRLLVDLRQKLAAYGKHLSE